MKLWLSLLAILLPLGVMAAPAGNSPLSVSDLEAHWGTLPGTAQNPLPHGAVKGPEPFLLAAEGAADAPGKSEGSGEQEVDLRDVDWDKAKADKKDGGKAEVGNGDQEEEGDGEAKEEEGEEEKGDGEGGWDRLWDASKLG